MATVNALAHEIGIDQSGASRLLHSAASAGYVQVQISATDGRQRHATVTLRGHTMLADAHNWQEQVFHRLTDGWTAQQRREFQHAMTRLVERSYASNA
jgi:DNA-binding MarR family transcriptional regulator